MPLELAYTGGKPLAVQDVSLVFEAGLPAGQALAANDRLRILAVFSLPQGGQSLNLRQERYQLKQLLTSLAARRGGAVDLRVLQYGVTRQLLKELLEEGDGWDVLHFSGHGLATELVLEHADGTPDRIPSEQWIALLQPLKGRLHWVTLSACLSAAVTVEEIRRWLGLDPLRANAADIADARPLPSLARRVAERLGCAVLAMRYPVADGFAIELGARIYRGVLEKGQPLARALQRALPDCLEHGPPLSVATPALFGGRAADLAFKLPAVAASFAPPRTGLAGFPPEPELVVGRVDVLTAASQALAPRSRCSGVLFYGMAGGGKTTCALEVAYFYRDVQRFQGFVWYKAPERGKDIATALFNFAEAMKRQLPNFGFEMSHVVDRADELAAFLPRLTELLEHSSILLVLDNLESLLSENGRWRDERWGAVITALLAHRGESRTVLTSRVRPALDLPADQFRVLAVHSLRLDEAALLARQMPNLGRLLRGEGAADHWERERWRELVIRALTMVQGHPELLKLADGQAVDAAALQRQVERAESAWVDGKGRLEAFFRDGTSTLKPEEFLNVLGGWTESIAAPLPEPARELFHFLCCVEEDDRQSGIVEGNWADCWRRLERAGDAPDLAANLAILSGVGLVAVVGVAEEVRSYRIHPGVAEAGRRLAGETVQVAVDAELAAFWNTVFWRAWKNEIDGGTARVILAGQRAAPYLLRQRRWDEASTLLERVIGCDESPATVAAVLPLLRQIAQATAETEGGLADTGILAKVLLKAGRWPEAEAQLRELIPRAAEQGAFRWASVAAGELINLLRATGRPEEALDWVERTQDFTRRASLGPWTQLLDEGRRLQLLNALGRYQEVLDAVPALQTRLRALPETGEQEESVTPWKVQEVILNAGCSAAQSLERWELALALNAEIIALKGARHAPALELARTRFNDYFPLLRLGRYADARALLDDCRDVFEAENSIEMLGKVFSALADLEDTLGHRQQAIAFEETALRYKYLAGDPKDCAISHFNLAEWRRGAGASPEAALANRLAATLIVFQMASGRLLSALQALAADLADFTTTPPPLPAHFDALCEIVERQTDGVHFRELFARLPTKRAASGEEALRIVLEMAR